MTDNPKCPECGAELKQHRHSETVGWLHAVSDCVYAGVWGSALWWCQRAGEAKEREKQ